MSTLGVFNFMTANGYFKGPGNDISWHVHGAEENAFALEMLKQGSSILLFGRITYEMMAGYWPTADAIRNDPEVAAGMNQSEKVVFSRTLKQVEWSNTKLFNGNLEEEIRKLKKNSGKNITVLGSGSIVTQLAEKNLIDEYQLMIDPVLLGNGTSFAKGITHTLELEFTHSKTFKSGIILLYYRKK